MQRRTFVSLALAAAAHPASWAQSAFPSRPVRIVVPFQAGGSPDLIARLLGDKLSAAWGQSVLIENRAGASGGVGLQHVAQSPADGHTLIMGSTGPLTVNPAVNPAVGYDPLADLSAVSLVGKSTLVLMVGNDVPVRSLRELMELARREPGKLSYGSAGSGNLTGLVAEMMKIESKTDILHVPYKGTAAVKADVLGGRVTMFFDTLPAALPLIRAGQVRALAVTSRERTAIAPDLATFAESGFRADFDVNAWFGMLGPKGMPAAVTEAINSGINKVLEQPATRDQFKSWGIDPTVGPPAQLSSLMSAELARWKEVVRVANIKPA